MSDSESLVPRGWQRAGALAVFFATSNQVQVPDAIFASGVAKPDVLQRAKTRSKSRRPSETVRPLAAKLPLKSIQTFGKGYEAALVNQLEQLKEAMPVC